MSHLGQSQFGNSLLPLVEMYISMRNCIGASCVVGTGIANEEFPILCETCLGENPFIRMTKQPYGSDADALYDVRIESQCYGLFDA